MKRHLLTALMLSLVLSACDSQSQREARYLKRGQDYFDKGAFDKARLEYRNAARIAPVDPEPLYRLGLTDEAMLNIGAAYGDFMQAAERDKAFQPALLKIAAYDLVGGQIDDARDRVAAILALDADQPEGHALNAALLLRAKDHGKTEREARFALSRDPANITAYSALTGLYLATGDKEKATATIAEGVTKHKNELSLLLLQAHVAMQSGDYATLEAAYQKVFALQPDFLQMRFDLVTIYVTAGRLDDAERTLRDAVAAKPENLAFRHALVPGHHAGHRQG